jgi:hypothetical protein
MQTDEKKLFERVTTLLTAEYECAESLQATGIEVQDLLESGRYRHAKERLIGRGEVVDMMMTLDRQMAEALDGLSRPDTPEWLEIAAIARKLKDLLSSIMGVEGKNRTAIEHRCDEVGRALKKIREGKQVIQGYNQSYRASQRAYTQA